MIKKLIISFSVVGLILFWVQDIVVTEGKIGLYVPPVKETFENAPFGVGETIVYDVTWGGIKAGNVSIQIKNKLMMKDSEAFHVVVTAKSSKFFSVFFKVDDKIESYFDSKSLYSLRFEKSLKEGSYREERIIDYDHTLGVFEMTKEKKNTTKIEKGVIPFWAKDPISVLYYLRVRNLEINQPFSVTLNADGQNYNVEVNVPEKEELKTELGKIRTIVVKPNRLDWQGRVFEKNQSSLSIWLTDDEQRIPVLMKSKVKIGSLKFEIKEWRKSGTESNLESMSDQKEELVYGNR